MLMLVGNLFLDLLEFSSNPWIFLVAVSVEFCECCKSFGHFAVINEPARGFGEQEDEKTQDCRRDTLNSEGDTPLIVVSGSKAFICAETDPGCTEGANS